MASFGGGRRRGSEDSDLVENVITINRVAKVVKDGRRVGFSSSAIAVAGDVTRKVGIVHWKAI